MFKFATLVATVLVSVSTLGVAPVPAEDTRASLASATIVAGGIQVGSGDVAP